MTNLLNELNEQITATSEQIDALREARRYTETKRLNAADMVQNVPNNIYIEDWKREEKHLAKVVERLDAIYKVLSDKLEQLCKDYEKEEQRQKAIAQALKEQAENKQAQESPKTTKKGYIYKDTMTNLETKETKTYYMGVDGYIQDEPKYCTPYKLKKAVLNRIKKDMTFWGPAYSEIVGELSYIEGKRWLHVCEIVEIEY